MIRYLTYSTFHGKDPMVGSDYIRAQQLIKYWPEADLYKYGENPDALIFTKVFSSYDYHFPQHFENIKILDICDPMWQEGFDVAETVRAMDAVTCPSEEMAKFLRQLSDVPVYVVPDRWDLETFKKRNHYNGKAKTVVWFGYSHNAEIIKPALHTINELGLNLLIISNDDPLLHRFDVRDRTKYYKFKKFNNDTIHADLQEADFAILPVDYRPQGVFKSDNKTTRSILCGLPVAKTGDEMRLLMNPIERTKYLQKQYNVVKDEYDVRKSVTQMKEIINEAQSLRD